MVHFSPNTAVYSAVTTLFLLVGSINLHVHASPLENRTSSTLLNCLSQAVVPFRDTSSDDWATYSTSYNSRLQYSPAAVVLPTNNQQVSNAVACAHQAGIKVQAKSGGHSYASYSSGGMDGSLIVDLRSFQDVLVDSTGIATVGSGIRVGNLELSLAAQGSYGLSHGTCKGVGVGGHFTHGGFGYTSRMWGLALDSIVALDVVLANGTLVHTTNQSDPDLYWAMRGAGESFGVATTFYLQTSPSPASIVSFAYDVPGMFEDAQDTVAVFEHIDSFVQNVSVVDSKLGFGMFIGDGRLTIQGNYFGDKDTFTSKIEPELLRGLPVTPTVDAVSTAGWLTTLGKLDGSGSLSTPLGYQETAYFYASSVTIPESAPLTTAAWTSFVEYVMDQGSSIGLDWYTIINLHGGPGSQINTKDEKFAALRRGDLWAVQNWVNGPSDGSAFPTSAIEFIKGLDASMSMGLPSGEVLGKELVYVDSELGRDEAHAAYYGDEISSRLRGLKERYDPDGVFSNPQSF